MPNTQSFMENIPGSRRRFALIPPLVNNFDSKTAENPIVPYIGELAIDLEYNLGILEEDEHGLQVFRSATKDLSNKVDQIESKVTTITESDPILRDSMFFMIDGTIFSDDGSIDATSIGKMSLNPNLRFKNVNRYRIVDKAGRYINKSFKSNPKEGDTWAIMEPVYTDTGELMPNIYRSDITEWNVGVTDVIDGGAYMIEFGKSNLALPTEPFIDENAKQEYYSNEVVSMVTSDKVYCRIVKNLTTESAQGAVSIGFVNFIEASSARGYNGDYSKPFIYRGESIESIFPLAVEIFSIKTDASTGNLYKDKVDLRFVNYSEANSSVDLSVKWGVETADKPGVIPLYLIYSIDPNTKVSITKTIEVTILDNPMDGLLKYNKIAMVPTKAILSDTVSDYSFKFFLLNSEGSLLSTKYAPENLTTLLADLKRNYTFTSEEQRPADMTGLIELKGIDKSITLDSQNTAILIGDNYDGFDIDGNDIDTLDFRFIRCTAEDNNFLFTTKVYNVADTGISGNIEARDYMFINYNSISKRVTFPEGLNTAPTNKYFYGNGKRVDGIMNMNLLNENNNRTFTPLFSLFRVRDNQPIIPLTRYTKDIYNNMVLESSISLERGDTLILSIYDSVDGKLKRVNFAPIIVNQVLTV